MRTSLLVVTVAVAVGLAVAAPRVIVEAGRDPGPPAGSRAGEPACAARPDHVDPAVGEVAWVRLCPVAADGQTQAGAIPATAVLGDDAARLVAEWRLGSAREAGCLDDSLDFEGQRIRVQVGFEDETVQELSGRTSGCPLTPTPPAPAGEAVTGAVAGGDVVYRALLSAAGQRLAGDFEDTAPPVAADCPDRPGVLDQDLDGASAALLSDSGLVLALPVVEATVCAYRHGELIERSVVVGAAAESLRLTLHSDVAWGAWADCDLDPARPSYVVTLADKTGTRRGFAIDGPACHALVTSAVRPDGYSDFGLAYSLAVELGRS